MLPVFALRNGIETPVGVSTAIDATIQETAPGIFGIEGPSGEQAVAVHATGIDCPGASQPMLQIGPEFAKILSIEPSAKRGRGSRSGWHLR